MYELAKLLFSSSQGDSHATIQLITQFQPLLRKYTKMLDYEDAYEDLLLKFLELLKSGNLIRLNSSHEAAILLYFKTSIYHSFIALSKIHKRNSCIESNI